MPKPRKTIAVADLKDVVNAFNHNSANHGDLPPEFRQGLIAVLEHVLHETNNYHGFRYLDAQAVIDGSEYDETARHYL